MRVLPELGVLLCIEHGSCYIKTNVGSHLTRKYSLKGVEKKTILAWLGSGAETTLREDHAVRPTHESTPVYGLPIYSGYQCRCDSGAEKDGLKPQPLQKKEKQIRQSYYGFLSVSLEWLRQHQSQVHGLKDFKKRQHQQAIESRGGEKTEQAEPKRYREVRLQTL
ncbi:hypothetical protein EJ08DRAFT_201584 [Tothia fuscella]|uniref:Uncharacterized protein n=1 Tax=Tothia fuscella TaxID=1048955 RepID=A0A9P4TRR7_9PEZI|nr:hypothetical protein EJ08DRAFT_201584 [Tothia fuscella]